MSDMIKTDQTTEAQEDMRPQTEAIDKTKAVYGFALVPTSGGSSKNITHKRESEVEVAPQVKRSRDPEPKLEDESLRVVVFKLAGHEHAVDVRRVREIIMAPSVSSVIEAPDFVDGVIKLRGRIVPVVDLRKRLQLAETGKSDETRVVIIVQLGKKMTGFGVDSVSELLTVPTELIHPPNEIVGGVKTSFIDGLAYVGQRFLVILNLDAILSVDEERQLQDVSIGQKDENREEGSEGHARVTLKRIITFELDNETYGVEISEVAEIMEMVPIMPLPNVPAFILGMVNLRGDIVPVVDLRVRFGLDRKAWTSDSRIVMMKTKDHLVGMVVDSMWESLRLQEESFQPVPQGVAKIDAEYFNSICSVKGRMVCILDIGKILTDTAGKSAFAARGAAA